MSAASDLAPILQRLERLERQNRLRKSLVLALLGFAGLGILVAAQEPPAKSKLLTTERLVLQDDQGKPRMMFATHKNQSGIVFYGPDGQLRAFLVAEPNGVALRFMRPGGLYTSGISCERGGVGLIGINDAGRNQTEVNAIIVPGRILLKDYNFPVKLEDKK
jgi:hypothetical protein